MKLLSYRPSAAADAVTASIVVVAAVQCTFKMSDGNDVSMHLRDNSSCQDPLRLNADMGPGDREHERPLHLIYAGLSNRIIDVPPSR